MSFDSILALPLGWAYLTLFTIVMLRANATYWVGRLLVAGGRRSPRIERFIEGPTMAKAKRFSDRWGVLAVPLSFLTIGIQTAVNLSAGALRMPLTRYLPAMTLGCMMWALVYSTIGLAALQTIFLALASSPWALVALAVAVLGVLGVRGFQRRAARAREADEPIVSADSREG
ncbi:MAG: VTT domain-containing protein [Propionibacteriaceae bacterium]|nr:VTT domain-containing protein [Propionibacteriaceae bacterium]